MIAATAIGLVGLAGPAAAIGIVLPLLAKNRREEPLKSKVEAFDEWITCGGGRSNKGELPTIPVDERAAEVRAIQVG